MKKIFSTIVLLTLVYMAYAQLPSVSVGDSTVLAEIYKLTGGPEGKWVRDWPYDRVNKVFTARASTWTGIEINALGFVISIDLNSNGLIGDLPITLNPPQGVQALTRLKYVDLGGNTQLSGYIAAGLLDFFKTIVHLNFSGTRISGVIPAEINKLTKLEYLDLSAMGITGVAPEIGSLSYLKTLNLSSNELTAIPATIFNLNRLEFLYLNDNRITDIPIHTVVSIAIAEYVNVKNNKLDFCDIENLKAGFPKALITASPQNTIANVLPKNVSGEEGTALRLDANVCGALNTYQWQKKNGANWVNIANATASGFTITSPQQTDNGEYRSEVKNPNAAYVTIYSEIYKVTLAPDWASDLSITTLQEDVPYYSGAWWWINFKMGMALYNVWEASGFKLDAIIVTPPVHGTATPPGWDFTYYPEANYFGTDKIVYKFKSRINPAIENTGTISLTINPVNDPPTLTLKNTDDSPLTELNVNYGSTVQFKAIMSDAVDKELACSNLILKNLSASLGGLISYNASTSIATYNPTKNTTESDYVQLVALEGCQNPLQSNTAILKVNITELISNTPPVASNANANAKTGERILIALPATDNETSLNNLSVYVTTFPRDTSYFDYQNGNFYYQSKNTFEGPDSFKFKVTDEKGVTSNEATVTITVKFPDLEQLPVLEGTSNVTYIGYKTYYYQSCYSYKSGWWGWRTNCNMYPYYQFEINQNPYIVESTEYSRYPNTYLEVFNDDANSFFTDYYQNNQRIGINTSVIQSYWSASNTDFVQNINNAFTNKFVTLNYRQKGTGWLIATRKVHITLTYQGLKSAETIAQSAKPIDQIKEMLAAKNGSLNDDPSLKSDTIFSSIISFIDTAVVNYGSSTPIKFMAMSPSGQLGMGIVEQPKKGKINDFVFDSFFAELITNYKGDYTPTENKESWDSIKYSIFNKVDTLVQTKYIHILTKKVAPQIASIGNQQVNEDQTKEITLQITDGDNPISELNVSAKITSTSTDFVYKIVDSKLSITPPANFNGSAFVEISVMDPDLQNASTSFDLTVLPQNDLPEFNLNTNFELLYNTKFSENISVSDIDNGDIVTLTYTKLPGWLTYQALTSSLGVLSGTPAAADAGIHSITFTANDGTGSVTKTIEIKVIGQKVDNPPVVANPISPIILPKASAPKEIDLSLVFTDPDGDAITISVAGNNNPKWLTTAIQGTKLTLSIADKAYTGFASISLEAKSNGLKAFTTVDVSTDDKSPVLLKQIDNITVWKNQAPMSISLADVFSDPDGDPLTFSLSSNTNPGIVTPSFSDNKLILTFAPTKGGTAAIIANASAYGDTVQVGFWVTIKDAAPTINKQITTQTIFKNTTATIDVSSLFIDSDDPQVNISIKKISDQTLLTGNVNGTSLVLTPLANKTGPTSITLEGSSSDKTIEYTFDVLVQDRAPQVKEALPDVKVVRNAPSKNFDLTSYFTDPDNDPLTFKVKQNSNTDLITTQLVGNFLVVTFNADRFGTGIIEITASADNKEISSSLNVTVDYSIGVSFKETDNQITIWPNPAKEKVYMRYNSTQRLDNINVQLIDLAGRIIFSKKQESFISGEVYQFNFDPIESGAYLFQIKSNQKEINKTLIIR